MENSKKNGYLCDCLLPWQQAAIYSYERRWNPSCVPNLHGECQELKPKVKTNTSFLVRHPFSSVDTVKTVGSHLNAILFDKHRKTAEANKKISLKHRIINSVRVFFCFCSARAYTATHIRKDQTGFLLFKTSECVLRS